jgi:ABC-type Fe3+/spermidine/putrescine transport system ATPase subunit
VELRNVVKKFGRIVALRDIDLKVLDREYVTVLGSTGAGKTTLLNVISGVLRPNGGEVYIDGKLVNDTPPEERYVAYFPQNYALFPHMTAEENVAYGPIVRGASREESRKVAQEALELVGLEKRGDSLPAELSGGMQQRVALARAIAAGSRLLLLDEPLSALDAVLKVDLRYELRDMAKELGLTVIHVTHDQGEAMSISDRVVILKRGVVEQSGTPREIYEEPRSIFVANFVGDMNFYEGIVVGRDGGGIDVEIEGEAIRIDRDIEVENVVVAIRPEDVGVVKGERKDGNLIPGTVEALSFSAGIHWYKIHIFDRREVLVKRLASQMMEEIQAGDRVSVHFQADKILVYPYPREGLIRALEVD